ncbi:MAG: hypothetical protein WC044_01595 [Crocinitomicaceae bacterium]
MDIYRHTNPQGVELFHLIHFAYKDELGIERKKLVSSIPTELMKSSNEKIYGLFELQSKRIESDWKMDILESLGRSVAEIPLSHQFCYPSSLLSKDGTLTASKLHQLVKGFEDLQLKPGNYLSENHCPVKHFVLCSKFYQYREFSKERFIRDVKLITRSEFEVSMETSKQWNEYQRYLKSKVGFLNTKTVDGYNCNILFHGKGPVFEFIY